MPKTSTKLTLRRYLLGLGALSLLTVPLSGQVYTAPTGQPAPSNGGGDTTIIRPQKTETTSPFGNEIPLLDPSAETIAIGGKSFPIMDSRLIKARFEKFLNQPAENAQEAAAYHAVINEILGSLSPQNTGPDKLEKSFRLLPKAAAYPGDANLSSSLAQAVYTGLQAKNDIKGLSKINESLEREKKDIIRDDYWERERLDSVEDTTASTNASKGKGKDKTKAQKKSITSGNMTMKQAEWKRRFLEIEVLKKKNIAKTEAGILQSKIQYQANMAQWTIQRRFQHVLMASRFYNEIWRDGKNKLHIKKGSDLGSLFTEGLGISPTVNGLDSLANEAIRETEKAVDAFNYLLTQDEVHTASMRLMEAFAIGEHLAPIATLPIESKRRVQLYIRELYELHGAMEAHDLTRARTLIDSLKKQAKDFPASKAESPLAGMTMAANLKIEAAKAALLQKDTETATENITEATKLWPTNPKLAEFTQLMEGSSVLVVAKNDYDRLLSEQNYREIFKRQYELAPALSGDEERKASFKEVITNLTRIEMAIGKANEFAKAGSPYDAYEQLAILREDFPDDPELGRQIEQLAPQVADFTRAINKAKNFAQGKRPQLGSALSHYLKAQSLHPRSEIAEKGIDSLVEQILENGS